MKTMEQTSAPDVSPAVKHFELQLMLPLSVDRAALSKLGGSAWTPLADLLKRPATSNRSTAAEYAEMVYFHPIIQERLLGRNGKTTVTGGSKTIKAWERNIKDKITFWLPWQNGARVQRISFDISGLTLHQFDLGEQARPIVILTVCLKKSIDDLNHAVSTEEYSVAKCINTLTGLDNEQPLNVDGMLNALDFVRRIYPGYIKKEGGLGGRSALAVSIGNQKPQLTRLSQDEIDRTISSGHPPLLSWVKELLEPLHIGADDGQARLVLDERMQQMAFISVDQPGEVSNADLARMAWADQPADNRREYSYDPRFMNNWQQGVTYDRWRHYGTRYLCTGYNWAMLVDSSGFALDVNDSILGSFRGCYYQFGLLVTFYKAALLSLSEQLSNALDHGAEATDPEDEVKRIEAIYESVLLFSQRYWFESPTNQLQGEELFNQYCQQSGVNELNQRVMLEAQTVSNYLQSKAQAQDRKAQADARKAQEQDRLDQERLNRSITRLTVGQLALALVGLFATSLSVNDGVRWIVLPLCFLFFILTWPSIFIIRKLLDYLDGRKKFPAWWIPVFLMVVAMPATVLLINYLPSK